MRFLALPLVISAAFANILTDVQQSLSQRDLTLAEAQVKDYQQRAGVTPEMLEALSWIARVAFYTNQLDRAEADATPNGKAIFWKVEKEGKPASWLLGTMHVTDPRVLAMPASTDWSDLHRLEHAILAPDLLRMVGAALEPAA